MAEAGTFANFVLALAWAAGGLVGKEAATRMTRRGGSCGGQRPEKRHIAHDKGGF
jgi:hypothetical protein